jgi:hypothetical protein
MRIKDFVVADILLFSIRKRNYKIIIVFKNF